MTSKKIHSAFKKNWQEIVENIHTKTPTQQKQSNAARLKNLCRTLRQSKTGEALLDWAEEHNISILIDHQLDPKYGAVYMVGTNIILLSGQTNDDVLVSNLAHEIRHAWQSSHGFFSNAIKEDAKNDLSIAYNITMPSLLLEADAFAHQLQVTAELAQKNIKKPWNDLTEKSGIYFGMYSTAISDYQHYLEASPASINNGQAMKAAFYGWFSSPAKEFYIDLQEPFALSVVKNRTQILRYAATAISLEDVDFQPAADYKEAEPILPYLSENLRCTKSYGIDFYSKESLNTLFQTLHGKPYLTIQNDIHLSHHMFKVDFSDQFKDIHEYLLSEYQQDLDYLNKTPLRHSPPYRPKV